MVLADVAAGFEDQLGDPELDLPSSSCGSNSGASPPSLALRSRESQYNYRTEDPSVSGEVRAMYLYGQYCPVARASEILAGG
jgi:hypothetical protein